MGFRARQCATLRSCTQKKSWISEDAHRLPASLSKTEHGRWGIIARSHALLCRCIQKEEKNE